MDLFGGRLYGFFLILTRLGAFFAAAPIFSWDVLSVQLKIAAAILLSLFFTVLTPPPLLNNPAPIEMVLLLGQEVFYGLAMGIAAYCLFSVIHMAGQYIEQEMGLSIAQVFDPFSGEEGHPLGLLLEILFILLLFSTNSHFLLLEVLSRSLERFPPTSTPHIGALMESILRSGSAMFLLALQLAAPILAAFMLLLVVLAFMARIAPESNVLFLSFPLRIGIGLLIIGFFIPYLNEYIQQFAQWLNRLLPF
ncbi:MAG TPA: flagellar biosynthetic protein FliR [Anaerohalosphaeraceae bacterium]|nr:flagellar biosynthetic protein FliR [Anaerohalosphaeraceae bacterium]